jgi:hypothetical protein
MERSYGECSLTSEGISNFIVVLGMLQPFLVTFSSKQQ